MTTFRAFDPGEAVDVIRRRHSGCLDIRPAHKGNWSYTASNIGLAGIDLGRQATSGFSSTTGRDTEGLRLMIVQSGEATASLGSEACVYDSGSRFGFCHPEACGAFTNGYVGVAVRLPVSALCAALALIESDADPIRYAEVNWAKNNLPGVDRFYGLLTGLLAVCEQSSELLGIAEFRTAQAQLLTLHAANMIAAGEAHARPVSMPGSSASLRACVDFIHAHSRTSFDYAQLARYAGISLRTAQALFSGQLGTTISSYLRSYRLDRVRSRLLTEGDATVTGTALDEGFTHLGEFSRWYARRFGEKPSETLRAGRMRRLI
jgi:AraC-like DNA-binding protein